MAARIVFMGSPEFALPTLKALVTAGYDIAGVYTAPDREAGRGRRLTQTPVKELAGSQGLPVFQPASLRPPEVVAELASLRPEVIVIAAYGQILRQPVLDLPPNGVINVHPSLLPRHRGAAPVAAAILAGDETTGVTIMRTEAGIDSGPILSQRSYPIAPTDTTASLTPKLAELGAELLIETLPGWLDGTLVATPQDETLASYTPMIRREEALIDWRLPAVELWRRVRAYNPWPGAYTFFDREQINIWQAWPLTADLSAEPGTIVPLERDRLEDVPGWTGAEAFGVQTGEGVLAVLQAQRAGRKAMPADEFLRGQRDFLGRRFAVGK